MTNPAILALPGPWIPTQKGWRIGHGHQPVQDTEHQVTNADNARKIDGLNIAIVGDLKYGRTVYSLIYGLLKYNSRIFLVSPPSLKVRKEAFFNIHEGISFSEHESLDEIFGEIDVIYVTRIQKERFFDPHEYEKVQGSFVLDLNTLEKGKKDLIVMHPLPRVGEIHPEVDNSPYAKYFLQTHLGKTVRAALIASMLNSEV